MTTPIWFLGARYMPGENADDCEDQKEHRVAHPLSHRGIMLQFRRASRIMRQVEAAITRL